MVYSISDSYPYYVLGNQHVLAVLMDVIMVQIDAALFHVPVMNNYASYIF